MRSLSRALPVVLAALVLAAHFFRSRSLVLMAVSLALPFLLAVGERWSARAVQAGLLLGAVEWVRTLVFFAGQRMEAGRPWLRLALILGAVAALTALSALAVKAPPRHVEGAPAPGTEGAG
ncbi:MAG: hypothetical protein U0529_12635 [Thermoanaerobaculia bacterium]